MDRSSLNTKTMSDAKAKAEARRAKILARDASSKRTVSAVTDVIEEDPLVDLSLPIGPTTPKERPLAARRRLIEAKVADSDEPKPEDAAAASSGETDQAARTPSSSSAAGASSSEQKEADLKLPPKKTLEEVEREVAENTAKFDEKALSSKKEKQAEDNEASAAALLKASQKTGLDGPSVMRLVRLLLIAVLALYSGYRTVDMNRQEALRALVVESHSSSLKEMDEFGGEFISPSGAMADTWSSSSSSSSSPSGLEGENTEQRTWGEYLKQKFHAQLECPVSAVALVYYLSRILAPAITAQLAEKKKPSKPLEMIMEFLTTGLSGYVESAYNVLGEICLHLVLLVLSVVLFTLYYSPAMEAAASSPAAEL